MSPFVWRNLGFDSYLGGGEAVVQTKRSRWKGFVAYQLWRSVFNLHGTVLPPA